jgi:hypothetical protein
MTVCGFHAALYGAESTASESNSIDLSNESGDTSIGRLWERARWAQERMAETGTLDRIAMVHEIWKTTPCKVAIIAGMIP